MIVLHAAYINDHLLLWGETSDVLSTSPSDRRGRKAPDNRTAPFFYGATTPALVEALAQAACEVTVDADDAEALVAWLPTVNGQALASSPLVAELPESEAAVTLAPWTVTALRLTAPAAMALLRASVGHETL